MRPRTATIGMALADFVYVAQVTIYARALGVALAQKAYDTHESSERAAL